MKAVLFNTVQNIVAKGETSHHEQLLPLQQCFKTSSDREASESVCILERVNRLTRQQHHHRKYCIIYLRHH